MRVITLVAIVTVFVFSCSTAGVLAQESPEAANAEAKQQVQVVTKEITGMVVGISNRFIAVAGGVNPDSGAASELAFNLDKDVQLVHKRSLKDIRVGDTVKVSYEEKTVTPAEGRAMRSNTVKTITFLKPAAKDLTAQEQTQPQQEARSDEEGLSLKGERGR